MAGIEFLYLLFCFVLCFNAVVDFCLGPYSENFLNFLSNIFFLQLSIATEMDGMRIVIRRAERVAGAELHPSVLQAQCKTWI